ncbi:MAG: DUF1641 domain-containing protein [Tumebacillaceae bacterium]
MATRTTRIEKAIPNPQQEQAQALGEILSAIADNRTAIIQFMDILKELHSWGILDALQGLVKNRHDIGVIGVTQLNKPGAQHILKNGMSALQMLASIDPNQLQSVLNGVTAGLDRAGQQMGEPHKPLGMFDMIKTMRDPEVGASLQFMMNFLRGMSGGMQQNNVH